MPISSITTALSALSLLAALAGACASVAAGMEGMIAAALAWGILATVLCALALFVHKVGEVAIDAEREALKAKQAAQAAVLDARAAAASARNTHGRIVADTIAAIAERLRRG